MKKTNFVVKSLIAGAILLSTAGATDIISENTSSKVDAKTHSKNFTVKKTASKKSALPSSIVYTKTEKQGIQKIKYSGYLHKKSVKKSGKKYVGTYKGKLFGRAV